MTQQTNMTAVEWLVEKLMKGEFINNPNELIEQAKQMEKEKILDNLIGFQIYLWLIDQLRQLSHSLEAHLGSGDIRITQGMLDDFEEEAKQMEKEYIEISDEEIENEAERYEKVDGINSFKEAIKWYREQLKNK